MGRGSERRIKTEKELQVKGGLAIRRGPWERPRPWGLGRDELSGLRLVPAGPQSAAAK